MMGVATVKISKILSVGENVYSAANGKPMKVTRIYSYGFDTEEDYYDFDECGKLFFLHPKSFFYLKKTQVSNIR
jgi:hypothetical protein